MLLDPWWTLRTGAVPYWTVFPVQPAVEALHRYLDTTEPYGRLHVSLFCHGVDSVGMATTAEWRSVLRRATVSGRFAGVSPERYPSDLQTFFAFQRALRTIPDRHPLPPPLPMATFEEFLCAAPERFPGVRLSTV